MALGLYTVFCDFRGGTYASQVRAADEIEALRAWATYMIEHKPVPRVSRFIANSALETLEIIDEILGMRSPPTPLETLTDVWCSAAICGGDLALINIVRTAEPV